MKKIMNFYNTCKTPIRITFIAMIFLSVGYLIKNENLNILYTFKNSILIGISEIFYSLGQLLISNLPLIFLIAIVAKKSNNGFSIFLAIIGYFAFFIATSLNNVDSLDYYAYSSGIGINGFLNSLDYVSFPLEMGTIGAIISGFITRYCFIYSRNRIRLLYFVNRDTVAILMNLALCIIAGFAVSLIFPYMYSFLQMFFTYIAEDFSDSVRLAIYGILDRVLSLFNLSAMIKSPFWYTSLGGIYTNTLTGQVYSGDVEIWKFIYTSGIQHAGVGKFTSPYFIINIFIIPAYLLSTWFTITDSKKRIKYFVILFLGALWSIICGNPLPFEMIILCTAPGLYVIYLFLVGLSFGLCTHFQAFIGYISQSMDVLCAMPGSIIDLLINIRNQTYLPTLYLILEIGAIMFVITVSLCYVYYRFLSYDFFQIGKTKKTAQNIIKLSGGYQNIKKVTSSFLQVKIHLYDVNNIQTDVLDIEMIQTALYDKETITIDIGSHAYLLVKTINSILKKEISKKNENLQAISR